MAHRWPLIIYVTKSLSEGLHKIKLMMHAARTDLTDNELQTRRAGGRSSEPIIVDEATRIHYHLVMMMMMMMNTDNALHCNSSTAGLTATTVYFTSDTMKDRKGELLTKGLNSLMSAITNIINIDWYYHQKRMYYVYKSNNTRGADFHLIWVFCL